MFPLVCGIWLDICSLRLFNTTLIDRLTSFEQAPGTSMFLHWLVGMVYVFYFATFVFLLREVLRPGLLWFLRNLNDPDFNPVQEMIQLPVYRFDFKFNHSFLFLYSLNLIFFFKTYSSVLDVRDSVRFLDRSPLPHAHSLDHVVSIDIH